MTTSDIRKLVKYLWNSTLAQFSQDIYHKEPDGYVQEKFDKMKDNTMMWIGALDELHLQRLVDQIDEYEG
jgi:hypothetical protein